MLTPMMKQRLAEIRENVQIELKIFFGVRDAAELALKTPPSEPPPRVINEAFLLDCIHELEKQLWYLKNQDGSAPEQWEFGPVILPVAKD